MLERGLVIEDRLLTLADLGLPILSVVGTVDEIAATPGVRAIRQAAARVEVFELALTAGHFGLVVGSRAASTTSPTVAEWVRWRAGLGKQPGLVETIPDQTALAPAQDVGGRLGYTWSWRPRWVRGRSDPFSAGRVARSAVRELTAEAASQLPRLVRLEHVQPRTRISSA